MNREIKFYYNLRNYEEYGRKFYTFIIYFNKE